MTRETEKFGLNSNILKIIALITMTIDHVGVILLPQYQILRIIGRIAFPIFAYMIAEGCFYTKHKKRYLGEILAIGALCQIFYFIFDQSFYMCILITFSLSIIIIYSIQWARKKSYETKTNIAYLCWLLPAALIAGAYIASVTIPGIVGENVFAIDYGFVGIIIPVILYLVRDRWLKLLVLGGELVMLALSVQGTTQWWALLALIPLAFYNGERGRLRIGQLFYIYYPLHLAVLWGISYAI